MPDTADFLKQKCLDDIRSKLHGDIADEDLLSLDPSLLDALRQTEVKHIFVTPQRSTNRESEYQFGGIDLKPGEKIMVIVPQGKSGILKDVILGHRKREAYWNIPAGGNRKDHDPAGAYSRIRAWDENSVQWKEWKDPKGYDPKKYAERRSDIEYEILHDWYATVGSIQPSILEITSAGNDQQWSIVTVYSLNIITHPEISENTETREHIFSPGTSFVDLQEGKQKLPQYGGGKAKGGYPDAVPLGGKNAKEPFKMTESIHTETEYLDGQNRLHILLPPNKKILSLEVSIGDTWFNYKGSGQLQLGWAKLHAVLAKKNGEQDTCMNAVNIPPQGVLSGGPTDSEYITQEGDEIIVSSQNTSYLMGWRILLESVKDEGNVQKAVSQIREKTTEILGHKKPLHLTSTGIGAGTQGGKWHIDSESDNRYFVKDYGGKFDRCATEYITNEIYQRMDIPVPETQLLEKKCITKEMQGLTEFDKQRIKKHDKKAVKEFFDHPDVRNGFVVDAWLANWDIFGLDYDNVLKTPYGRMVRIDGGGALFYRGMGAWKPSFGNPAVTEITTMRDPKMAREAGYVFHDITDEEIRSQVKKIVAVMTDDVIDKIVASSGISNKQEVIAALIKRRNWLAENFG